MSNQRRFALIGRGFGSDNFDEYAQDLVGALLIDSTELDFTYTDATPSITAALKTASVVFAKLQNFDALSVLGRSANSAGVGDEIAAATDGDILRRSGTTLGFGQTLPGNYTFSGTNLFTADVEILGVVTGVHATFEDTSTGGITFVGGTPSTTSAGGDIRLTAGAGGFTSGDGGIVLLRGGATGTSPAGRAALEGGRAFGTGAGGDVGFQGGQSDAGQGGHGTFYSGTGATHVGDLYFGLGQNGAYIALRIVGDTHAWEIGGATGTASQSILQSGGSAAAPSWLTAGTNDRLLRQTGGVLNFGQLTAGMFPNTVVPDAALSSNVPLLNATNIFNTDSNHFGTTGADSGSKVLVRGTARAIRFGTTASTSVLEGVDQTGFTSYQPLTIGGSALNLQISGTDVLTISSSGQLTTVNSAGFTIGGTGETLATFVDDGACTFYHNNTARLATSATGADVTGILTATAQIRTGVYTVGTLPGGTQGDRALVTDALAPAFGAAVAAGGAAIVPVYYTGAAWFVG